MKAVKSHKIKVAQTIIISAFGLSMKLVWYHTFVQLKKFSLYISCSFSLQKLINKYLIMCFLSFDVVYVSGCDKSAVAKEAKTKTTATLM